MNSNYNVDMGLKLKTKYALVGKFTNFIKNISTLWFRYSPFVLLIINKKFKSGRILISINIS